MNDEIEFKDGRHGLSTTFTVYRDEQQLYINIEGSGYEGDNGGSDILTIDQAKQLRDWLVKVLP